MIPRKYIDYYGDQTRWFVGNVISISDPEQLGRIRVRIHGIHSENKTDIPDTDLPWAQVVVPITQGGNAGFGNNLGIQINSLVFGVFLDGANSQLPLVVGSLPKLEEDSPGGRSTNQLARGTNTLTKTVTVEGAPPEPYAAEYPHNKVIQTTSGHVIEIDDTPNHQRIHIHHKSGSFIEFHPDGSLVVKTKNTYIDAGENANLKATNVRVDANLVDVNATHVDVDATTVAVDASTVNVSGSSGDVVVSGVSLVNHTHQHQDTPGLGAGVNTTFPPNKGAT